MGKGNKQKENEPVDEHYFIIFGKKSTGKNIKIDLFEKTIKKEL